MPIDYTKIKKKLTGKEDDGQDVLRLRTGVVSVVNANGTVDVTLSGVTMTGLPRLDGLLLAVGESVQVVTYRGSMLVLGRVAASAPSSGAAVPVYKTDTNNPTFTGSTAFTATGNVFGAVFIAPPTGSVEIDVQQWLSNNSATLGRRSYATGQIRDGAVINSGTIIDTAIDNKSGMYETSTTTASNKYAFVYTSYMVSGLTPGGSYNVTWMGRVDTAADTGAANRRRLTVRPLAIIPTIS